MLDEYKTSDQF
jgi:hypothetical protein